MALACLLARGHLLIEDLPGRRQDDARARRSRARSGWLSSASSSPATCCPPTSSACRSTSATAARFKFHPGPDLRAVHPRRRGQPRHARRRSRRCSRRWRSTRSPPRARRAGCRSRSSSIATQNPSHQVGTFPLPESQLDRFLMRIELGYPDRDAERALLQGVERRDMIAHPRAVHDPGELVELQQRSSGCTSRPRCSTTCRRSPRTRAARRSSPNGLSPRAGACAHRLRARLGADRGPRPCDARGRAGGAAGRSRTLTGLQRRAAANRHAGAVRRAHERRGRRETDSGGGATIAAEPVESAWIPAEPVMSRILGSRGATSSGGSSPAAPRPSEARCCSRSAACISCRRAQGVLFGAALLLMLIGSINYQLSLGFILTFLLAGMAIVAILPHLPQPRAPAR